MKWQMNYLKCALMLYPTQTHTLISDNLCHRIHITLHNIKHTHPIIHQTIDTLGYSLEITIETTITGQTVGNTLGMNIIIGHQLDNLDLQGELKIILGPPIGHPNTENIVYHLQDPLIGDNTINHHNTVIMYKRVLIPSGHHNLIHILGQDQNLLLRNQQLSKFMLMLMENLKIALVDGISNLLGVEAPPP